jgi:hypothetical protein
MKRNNKRPREEQENKPPKRDKLERAAKKSKLNQPAPQLQREQLLPKELPDVIVLTDFILATETIWPDGSE